MSGHIEATKYHYYHKYCPVDESCATPKNFKLEPHPNKLFLRALYLIEE